MLPSTLFRTATVVVLAIALVGSAVALGGVTALDQIQDADYQDAESDADVQQSTSLRVVHASPDAPAVDVLVDDETVLSDVAFGDVSDYLSLEAGTSNVTIVAADDPDAVVFDDEVTFEPRTVTTVAASGEIGENASASFQPVAFENDAFTPADNESALSVVHLAPDAPAVDVTADDGSVVLAENVSYQNGSDYVTVPPGNYTVEIREATEANNGSVLTTADVSLENGTAYSAFAVGYLNADEAPADTPLEVVLTEDATLSLELPGDEATDDDIGGDDGGESDDDAETDDGAEVDDDETDGDDGTGTDEGADDDTGDDGDDEGADGDDDAPGDAGDDDGGDANDDAGDGDDEDANDGDSDGDDDGDAADGDDDGDDSSDGDDGTDDSSAQTSPRTLDECRTIDEPGTYELTQDVGSNAQSIDLGNDIVRPTCLAVQSSDVVLDGGGSVVSGSGQDMSVGVHVYDPAGSDVQNVTVRDLQVEGWSNGVQVGVDTWAVTPAGTATASFENVQSNANGHHGFFVVGSGVELSSVGANDNGGSGIGVFESSGVQVTGATTTGNADHGVALLEAVVDSSFSGVTSTGNGGAETYIGQLSSGNEFSDLTFGAEDDSIEGYDGSENTIDELPGEGDEPAGESGANASDENEDGAGESPGGNESAGDDAGAPQNGGGNETDAEADGEPEADGGNGTDAGNETAGDESEGDDGNGTDTGDGADAGNGTDAGDDPDVGDETEAADGADAGNETDAGDGADAGNETDAGEEADGEDETDVGDGTDGGDESAGGDGTDAADEPDAGVDTDAGNETAGNVSS